MHVQSLGAIFSTTGTSRAVQVFVIETCDYIHHWFISKCLLWIAISNITSWLSLWLHTAASIQIVFYSFSSFLLYNAGFFFYTDEDFNSYYRFLSGVYALWASVCFIFIRSCVSWGELIVTSTSNWKPFDCDCILNQLSAHQYFRQHCDGHKQGDMSALDLTPNF